MTTRPPSRPKIYLASLPLYFFPATSPSPSPRARPVPGGGRPKPSVRAAKPRATALYDYSAGDTDEISLCQGEIVEIINEGLLGFSSFKNKTVVGAVRGVVRLRLPERPELFG